ncbi:hypothetical protein Y032_0037g3394 [Ancylostoma ceylanicum]|uniref:Uncharacterized protein n=1 Tax=Ancylostoma ceylanicum TaxID=53326 RepID=A0A016UIM1_9BILA|nr:hypothetical protein Y032_0037g3394 [Ancylostoma ceylanicum]
MDGQLHRVIFFYELLLRASASERDDYTIIAFDPVLICLLKDIYQLSDFLSLQLGAEHASRELVARDVNSNITLITLTPVDRQGGAMRCLFERREEHHIVL